MNFFASNYFASNHFASNFFRKRSSVPVVKPEVSGGGHSFGESYDTDLTFKFEHDKIRADDDSVLAMVSSAFLTINHHG
jgi:hypothetical protein